MFQEGVCCSSSSKIVGSLDICLVRDFIADSKEGSELDIFFFCFLEALEPALKWKITYTVIAATV